MADDLELPARLTLRDGQFIKPNGYPILLHGPSFGSWGEDQAVDMAQIKAMGANCVRIALRWRGLHGTPNVDSHDPYGFAYLKAENIAHWLDMITAAAAAGLWVIAFIDSGCGQSGTQDADSMLYCDPSGLWGAQGRNFLTDPGLAITFAHIVWPAMAARLRTIAKIALLELQPEMMGGRGPEVAAGVRDFYREVIAGVRKVDKDTPFLIGARDNYRIDYCDEAWLEERDDVSYTGNELSHYVTTREKFEAGLARLVRMREERRVAIFVQQLGRKTGDDRDLEHMRHALNRMDEEGVGYAWWQWKQNTNLPNEYALNYKGGNGTWIQKTDEVALLTEHWTATT